MAVTGSAFAAPDLLNNASFEVGDSPSQWDGFTAWGSGTPDQGIVLDNTIAYIGSSSAKFPITANPAGDTGARCSYVHAAKDRIYCRLAFKLTTNVSSIMKFVRFYDAGINTPLGGVWLAKDGGGSAGGNGVVCVGWDQEDPGIVTTIGLTEAQVIDGNWHTLEVDYQRNGGASGFPEASFWWDGNAQYAELNGHSTVKFFGAGNSSTWVNGRINAGTRVVSNQIANLLLVPTLNANNTTTGQINIDKVALSTQRIGP